MKQVFKKNPDRANGNTTAEYALVGLLICVVSIGALLSFSGAFSARITDVKTEVMSKADQASQENAIRNARRGLSGQVGLNNPGFMAADSGKPGATATTGANGNTHGYKNGQKDDPSSQDANLTPAQGKLVTAIANNAHEVARLQEILKQIAKLSRGNRELFRNTTVIYKGQELTAAKIANWLRENGVMSEKLQTLIDKLAASGANSDVVADVSDITDDVTSNAADSSNATQDALNNTGSPTEVANNTNPAQTDQNASDICGAGGGTDTGTSCGG